MNNKVIPKYAINNNIDVLYYKIYFMYIAYIYSLYILLNINI